MSAVCRLPGLCGQRVVSPHGLAACTRAASDLISIFPLIGPGIPFCRGNRSVCLGFRSPLKKSRHESLNSQQASIAAHSWNQTNLFRFQLVSGSASCVSFRWQSLGSNTTGEHTIPGGRTEQHSPSKERGPHVNHSVRPSSKSPYQRRVQNYRTEWLFGRTIIPTHHTTTSNNKGSPVDLVKTPKTPKI